jgi:hypothetical protein
VVPTAAAPQGAAAFFEKGVRNHLFLKKVSGTICQQTPAFGRGRVASGDRQMVPDTFFG